MSYSNDCAGFATRLKKLMDERNISSYKLALELGRSSTIIWHWLRGENFPSSESLQKLAEYFRVSKTFLQTGEEEPAASGGMDYSAASPLTLPDHEVILAARKMIAAASRLDLDRIHIVLDMGGFSAQL